MTASDYLPFLRGVLTPPRLAHSLGVQQVMGELAGIFDLDRKIAEIAGILHDAGKDLDTKTWQQVLAEEDIKLIYPCDRNYLLYLHGPVGAALVHRKLGIRDPLLLAAIESHTSYGNSAYFDHPLCWCLRFADVLEPTRSWEQEPFMRKRVDKLRNLVYGGKMAEGVVYQTGLLMRWFEIKDFPIHPNMRQANLHFSTRI
jgi:predicted HD superfamily hydrolase involved in NAD metabolism